MIKLLLIARGERSFINFRLPLIKYLIKKNARIHVYFESLSPELQTDLEAVGVEVSIYPGGEVPRFAILKEIDYFLWLKGQLSSVVTSEYAILVYFLRSTFWFSIFFRTLSFKRRVFLIEGLGALGSLLRSRLLGYLLGRIICFIKSNSNTVVTLNQRDYELFFECPGRQELVVVPGIGFDQDKFYGQLRKEIRKVLFASRLIDAKGIGLFLEIVASNSDLGLGFYIAGSIDDLPRKYMRQFTQLVNNGKLTFLGFRTDLDQVLRETDILVFPSSYSEGLPRLVLEAMASGCILYSTQFVGSELLSNRLLENGAPVSQFVARDSFAVNFASYLDSLRQSEGIESLSAANISTAIYFNQRNVFPEWEMILVGE
jgi:glycosyltransferase involved in cell wall biosynthesis